MYIAHNVHVYCPCMSKEGVGGKCFTNISCCLWYHISHWSSISGTGISCRHMFQIIDSAFIPKWRHFLNYLGHQAYEISLPLYSFTCIVSKLCCVKWFKSHNFSSVLQKKTITTQTLNYNIIVFINTYHPVK